MTYGTTYNAHTCGSNCPSCYDEAPGPDVVRYRAWGERFHLDTRPATDPATDPATHGTAYRPELDRSAPSVVDTRPPAVVVTEPLKVRGYALRWRKGTRPNGVGDNVTESFRDAEAIINRESLAPLLRLGHGGKVLADRPDLCRIDTLGLFCEWTPDPWKVSPEVRSWLGEAQRDLSIEFLTVLPPVEHRSASGRLHLNPTGVVITAVALVPPGGQGAYPGAHTLLPDPEEARRAVQEAERAAHTVRVIGYALRWRSYGTGDAALPGVEGVTTSWPGPEAIVNRDALSPSLRLGHDGPTLALRSVLCVPDSVGLLCCWEVDRRTVPDEVRAWLDNPVRRGLSAGGRHIAPPIEHARSDGGAHRIYTAAVIDHVALCPPDMEPRHADAFTLNDVA